MRHTPHDVEVSAHKISRRALLLGASQLTFMGALGLRMRQLQIDEAEKFRVLADDNRILTQLLAPARGLIFDRNGTILAQNEQTFRLVIRREDSGDLVTLFAELRKLIDLTDQDQDRIRKELKHAGPSAPVTIKDRLSWQHFSEVAANTPSLPGVSLEVGLTREYPLKDDFVHLVGYVGTISPYDISRMDVVDPIYRIPRFQLGKSGVERTLEESLRGEAGILRVEKNVHGRIIREMSREEGINGENLQLTFDSKLQNFVQARLAGESASAVVIDIETGDVIASGSTPAYDPNLFVRGISQSKYQELLNDKFRPLPSKSVQGAYPPGSTFKMVTALAALEAGVISVNETVRCLGHSEVGGRKFHCWKRVGHGNMDLFDSLKHSCDVYYYDIAQRVGIDRIAEVGRLLGLGERYDLPLPGMISGLMPDKQWKRENRGADWVIGDSLNASIGQGFVLSTPMQLAVMTARLATGRNVYPRMIKAINGINVALKEQENLGINENNLRAVRKGMFEVVNTRRGTAYSSRIADDAMMMAGKTGTSQVRSAVVNNDKVPWEQRDHALFVAFAPYQNPKYALSVIVEHGGGGSKAAAPIARDIMLATMNDGFPPLEAYPSRQRRAAEERLKQLDLRESPLNSGNTQA